MRRACVTPHYLLRPRLLAYFRQRVARLLADSTGQEALAARLAALEARAPVSLTPAALAEAARLAAGPEVLPPLVPEWPWGNTRFRFRGVTYPPPKGRLAPYPPGGLTGPVASIRRVPPPGPDGRPWHFHAWQAGVFAQLYRERGEPYPDWLLPHLPPGEHPLLNWRPALHR